MVNVLFWWCTFLYVMEPKLSGCGFLASREGEKYFIILYECSELVLSYSCRVEYFLPEPLLAVGLGAQRTVRGVQAEYSPLWRRQTMKEN